MRIRAACRETPPKFPARRGSGEDYPGFAEEAGNRHSNPFTGLR
jgi:hypothetical protein